MKAAVYYNNRDVRIEERPVPEIKDGELLVKIEASGICGSDVMEWYRLKKAPLVLGHEIAGTIEKTGAGVIKFKKGDRVTVAHHVPCLTCRFCLAGNESVCDTLRTTNFDPGGFCEYVRVPAINVDRGVFRIPDNMSFVEATFSEPLGCVVRGFRKAGIESGKSMLVIGSGISGLLHIKLAKALGFGPITAVDINDYRISAASRFGADLALKAIENISEKMKEKFGRLADVVVLCAVSDTAITQALQCVERGGTIVFFAPKEPGGTYPMPLFDLWRDNITFINTYASPPVDTLAALDLIAGRRVSVEDMVSHRFPLKDAKEGFRLTFEARESLKVVIEPQT